MQLRDIFQTFPVLETERILLRAYTLADAPSRFALRTHPKTMKFMDSFPAKDIVEMEQWIKQANIDYSNKKGVQWVLEEKATGNYMGDFGFWRWQPQHFRAEIGYSLLPNYWGKGFMTEALICLVDFAFHTWGIHSIEANVNPINEASKRLLLKVGFKQEAYFYENYYFNGQFTDSCIFCIQNKRD